MIITSKYAVFYSLLLQYIILLRVQQDFRAEHALFCAWFVDKERSCKYDQVYYIIIIIIIITIAVRVKTLVRFWETASRAAEIYCNDQPAKIKT